MSKDLAAVMKAIRKDHGLTQNQMAKRCDVSAAVISRAETEPDYRVGRDSLEKIAGALELSSASRAKLFAAAGQVDVLAAQIREIAQLRAELAELRQLVLNLPDASARRSKRSPGA